MIERKFVAQKIKEQQVQEYIAETLTNAGHSNIEIKRTPLGEKIIVYTARPGLIVGRRGENIKRLTKVLKKRFQMENPEIEISEIENPLLDANSVADRIAYTFERYGPSRFKFIGHDMLAKIMDAGALGAEIVISGSGVPGSRSKSWRFTAGYLKKSGDIAENHLLKSKVAANLKRATVGIKVTIMPSTLQLPDRLKIKKEETEPEIIDEEKKEIPVKEEKKKTKKETKEKPKEEKKKAKKEKKNAYNKKK